VVVDVLGNLRHLFIHNPYPEVSFSTLFNKIWYEGYSEPEYIWQSSAATEEAEPKKSLTPLILGTVKGAVFAMIFAIPLALLGAIYTSQFMSVRLRKIVKPAIEFMAALPSVILGFLGALFFAPLLEKHLFVILISVISIPCFAILTLLAWRSVPKEITRKLPHEADVTILVLGLLAGFMICVWLGPVAEKIIFGDFKYWLSNVLNITYDPRNSLVVGFVMGFAVIPIIFTICEDSLNSVPKHLVTASLSCGATQWQTAVRVVLPVALSGIYSAIMIGFGRAIGETMIVLMATGNTPIMDFNPLKGFRALSANIAVEIPEAPIGESLYRVLFLSGLILFSITFVVNTLAELIRLRLRRKFSAL
jgi:phosphate transport system permease protein